MTEITQKLVKSLFNYDPETGKLIKKFSCGKEVKTLMNGYFRVTINYKSYLVHRLIWLYNYGEFPKGSIDHIDGNKRNNKLNNLRILNKSDNAINIVNRSNNISTVIGVSKHKASNKWQARISYKGKNIALGIFSSFDDAVIARYKAEQKYGYYKINNNTSAKQYLNQKKLAVHK